MYKIANNLTDMGAWRHDMNLLEKLSLFCYHWHFQFKFAAVIETLKG